MNKIIAIGRLGRDLEMRYTPNGQAVTSFSVASNRTYTTAAGERREETERYNGVFAGGVHGRNRIPRRSEVGLTSTQDRQ